MGKQKKDNNPTVRLVLDKSMEKRVADPESMAWRNNPMYSNVLPTQTRLHYRRDEAMLIDVNAVCEHFKDTDLQFEWTYREHHNDGSTGMCFRNTTKTPYATILTLNNIANSSNIEISAIISDTKNPINKIFAKNNILVQPIITPKEISDNIKWFCAKSGAEVKENAIFDTIIYSTIEIYGYNCDSVTVQRMIVLKEQTLFDITEQVVVSNNILLVKFNRLNIINKTKEGDVVTLKYVITDNDRKSKNNYQVAQCDCTIANFTLVEGEAADVLQPVVCGLTKIQENNFKQCKYTKIEAEYTKDKDGKEREKITVFQENEHIDPVPINLIGGSRSVTITLYEYTPDKCKLIERSHKSPYITYNGMQKNLDVKVSGTKGIISPIKIEYDYSRIKLRNSLLLPLKGICQQHLLDTGSANCRHNKKICLYVYPDVKWEAFMELGSSDPALYTHTNMPAEYGIFERHQEKAKDAGKRIKDINLSFGLQAEYKDGKTLDLTVSVEKAITDVADVIKIIRDAIDTLSFKKIVDANRSKTKASNIMPKSSKIPFFMEISSPVLHIGGGWQYDYGSSNTIIRKGEVAICAQPLIEVKGGIDLIACSTFIPVVGAIIKAILKINDLAEWLTDWASKGNAKYEGLIWFNIYLTGAIEVNGVVEFSSEEKNMALESPVNIIFGVELGLSAEVKVDTVTIHGATTHTITAGAEANAETGLTFNPSMGYNSDEGMYLGFEVRFDGISLTVRGEAKYERDPDNKKTAYELKVGGEKPYPLIDGCEIWSGKVYPFSDKKK